MKHDANRSPGYRTFTGYDLMTRWLSQGRYGGDRYPCQSASNLLSLAYN